jgi:hypothetical protein
MAINPSQYSLLVAAPMLQDYLVDKDTGTPLAGGIVTFYKDNERSILKNVYYQTGTPGNYSYIQLANPMTLTSVGTIADDNGNDVIPFYFPYDEDDSDIVETYYVTVYSANQDGSPAALQFTRENFPFISIADTPIDDQQDLINLMPNGQFTSHNDLPNDGLFPNGDSSVTVAQGGSAGWYYTKNNTSTDTDFVTFTQILQEPNNLVGNPRFSINIECDATSGNDTFKELRMRFNNVNRFASDTQPYTFSFSGISNTASNIGVFLKLIKYFGAGGSATELLTIEGFTLTGGYNQFSSTFIFGINSAATIGPNNDDYIELAIVLPATSTFDVDMTDFILTPGMVIFNDYPERPDNMVFANALTGSLPTPNPDGSDLYLPVVITQAGATFDTSTIGRIEWNINPEQTPGMNLLPCDGSVFLTSGYSSLGIPYSRLQAVLTNSVGVTSGLPLYGTGSTFATAYIMDLLPTNMRLVTNQAGSETAAADGVIPTGFTFSVIHTGQTSGLKAYSNGLNTLVGIANAVGAVTDAAAATSGFTVSQTVNNSLSYSVFNVTTIAASGIGAGTYFTFSVPGTNYYCWFTVNGAGADPAPGGTGIQVNLLTTYTAAEVARIVREAISGFQINKIIYTAANTITAGSYYTFNANGTTYSVWYRVNNAGSAPGTGTPIEVTLVGNETAGTVTIKTALAIDNYSFAVPDFRGMFLRAFRGLGQFDINASTRFSQYLTGVSGNRPGTTELDTFQSHLHDLLGTNLLGAAPTPGAFTTQSYTALTTTFTPANLEILSQGSAETQPVNSAVPVYIRY